MQKRPEKAINLDGKNNFLGEENINLTAFKTGQGPKKSANIGQNIVIEQKTKFYFINKQLSIIVKPRIHMSGPLLGLVLQRLAYSSGKGRH
ncbi:hypothetical protein NBG4_330021 [Candidatus Sulfobium mesophilum]|uniref:Uncharacterized protein n=1 Tax=Candidatus Sulfobium mesophilum TaxID=2016548 RepID=A0A2U3QHA5_9BACT|nr:hypothetical protein NBG4_330021 [Candidatus Sulfobium mesophilum]